MHALRLLRLMLFRMSYAGRLHSHKGQVYAVIPDRTARPKQDAGMRTEGLLLRDLR